MPFDAQHAEELFLAAAALPTEQRPEFLDQNCAGNAELRQRLERLLQEHDRAATSGYEVEAPSLDPAAAGTRLGVYKLLQRLGEGGMGTVWLAEQQEPVRRQVAVKLIKPGMDSAHVLARFEAERQALALMDHPNIARVLDAGETPSAHAGGSPRPYFVMELVRGIPITKYCDQERLTPQERLGLFVDVCQAVQHAHQKGIIHRDLKPSNVLVALVDGKPLPKVIDFGVAKATSQRLTDRTLFTEVGQVVGTLEYMAPEQAEPNNLDVDTRADVYSLGVLLYELLTGSPPFSRQQLHSAGFAEMLRIIREVPPPRPSTKLTTSEELAGIAARRKLEPSRLTRLVAGDLDWVVMKCLEKERSRRYETASALALDLQRYLANEPVLAGPPSVAYRLRKFVRRHRGPVVAGVLLLLCLLGGAAGTTVGMFQARQAQREEAEQRRIAEKNEEEQRKASERARQAAQKERQASQVAQKRLRQIEKANAILASLFTDLNPEDEKGGAPPLRAQMAEHLARASESLEGDTVGDPETVVRLQNRLGQALLSLGYPDRAVALLRKARATAEKLLPPDHEGVLTSVSNLADALRSHGEPNEAIRLFEPVLEREEAVLGRDHRSTLASMNNLALAYLDAGKARRALPLLEEALKRWSAKPGADHRFRLSVLSNLADAYWAVGRQTRALELFEQNLEQTTKVFGEEHYNTLASMNNLAIRYGRYQATAPQRQRAVRLLEQVHERYEKKLGPDHPVTLAALINLGTACKNAGEVDRAVALLERVLEKTKRRHGSDHLETAAALNALAQAYRSVGQDERALSLLAEALKIQRARQGTDHPRTLVVALNLAVGYRDTGKPERAIPLLVEILAVRRKTLGADHPDTILSLCHLADAYLDARQPDRAFPLFEECYRLSKARGGEEHRETLAYMSSLFRAYLAAGKPEKGLPLFSRSLAIYRKQGPGRHIPTLMDGCRDLVEFRQYAEAEKHLRPLVGGLRKVMANAWLTFDTVSLLGEALLGQKKYSEAETLLLEGYRGMKAAEKTIPRSARKRLGEAVERLVRLCEATDRKDEALRWREVLEALAQKQR
jgi:serine/threonine protein kinase